MEFLCEKYETEKQNLQEEYNFRKQNDKHNTNHNYDAGALSHLEDHYNHDDIVFLKAALQYAHNCVSTETILRTISSARKKHLIGAAFFSCRTKV